MLVLMRKPGEEVVLRDRDGQEIGNIRIVNVRGDKVRVAFDFPREIDIHRREVDQRIQEEAKS